MEVWLPKKLCFGAAVWAGSEGTSSFEDHEHNVDNLALEVVGQIGRVKWCLDFFGRLGARTGGIKLPHGNGHFVTRNEGCVLSELKFAELTSSAVFRVPEQLSCRIVTAKKPLSQHGRAATFEERDVLEKWSESE